MPKATPLPNIIDIACSLPSEATDSVIYRERLPRTLIEHQLETSLITSLLRAVVYS